MPDAVRTREQHRAQAAYDRVSAVAGEPWKEDYGRQCVHLPALIQQSGLCQALAFLDAKGADERKKPCFHRLLDDLAAVTRLAPDGRRLAGEARQADVTRYQWMTIEALKCAQWFKRYAEAVLKVEAGGEAGGGAP